MAKGFKYGSGGVVSVSGGLNFNVVGGTTEPASPYENLFWVNTEATITSWIFSATEPTEPIDGMVWISIGTSSSKEFNALQKNGIMVYPLVAKQYITDAWFDKELNSYQNGEWSDCWNGELFLAGDQYLAVTGGWSKSGYSVSSDFNSTDNSQVTIGDQIVCEATIVSNANDTDLNGACGTVNKVDITGYTKLRVKGSVTGYRSEVRLYIGVHTSKKITDSPTAKISITAKGSFDKVLTLPTSASSYYVFVLAAVGDSIVGVNNTTVLTIDSIALE